ncbi:hypothetical protein A3C23_04015 [Candidatus Roizmanbacteria bacterium RIFCSPHIGHO2_02_FULL_37_13b]|uniref:Uncharacterized protein n=1 Tax=Candidatus Roizmanbacteria bacterium RIFCSPLOWO2_02_FULL_36_11 TaxID=1802071 RepID=A0A1F7JGZ0_9BACT|nr:MAG: hypothetical protein A3C23_04015 [Candidatus Roizmanbacteria bacterium RIFCSPHIGHO2_02_FULL_37_13b]OGK54883.1 MAG: hypothetical protein A3H78_00165 [Candidatus Roizmanbacteria bacterium RIFCSPLOWO2_02_FULL_36_11]
MVIETLPISHRPTNPKAVKRFDIEKLLEIREKTERQDCSVEAIQQYLRETIGFEIPQAAAVGQILRTQRWQLVTVKPEDDIAALLFIAGDPSEQGPMPIEQAHATLIINRCPYNQDETYGIDDIQIAGVITDSNESPRILAVSYRTFGEMDAYRINISVTDDEFPDPPEDGSFVSLLMRPTLLIPTDFEHPAHAGLITEGMMKRQGIPSHHKVLCCEPKSNVTVISQRPAPDYFDRATLEQVDSLYRINFHPENAKSLTSWSLDVPIALDPVEPHLLTPN